MVARFSPPRVVVLAVVVVAVFGSMGLVAGVSVSSPARLTPHTTSALGASSSRSPSSGAPPSLTTNAGLAKALAIEAGLRAKGIDPRTVHLPDFAGMVTDRNRQVTPTYEQAPAPMGVSDIGLTNESGVLTPYELNTTSVAGTVAITNLQSLYVDGDGPNTYGIQLNSVVAGVTIFGNSSYEFWSQNYVDYTPSTEQLVFGDEVWNFSNPSIVFPSSSVYNFSQNGTWTSFPYLYQGYGPSITIGYPFTLTLYLNTSTLGDRPALYFNYTVSNTTFRQSSSFDYLVFNSTVGTPTSPAPTPYYQADGFNYDPAGLPNDMEIDILGNDDGDTTAFTAANATASLEFWNASAGTMEEVPSAINAGSETGETSVGLAVYSSGGSSPVGVVRSGPGFVQGLWNYSVGSGGEPVTLHLQPANAFLFVDVGRTNNVSTAQWVPTSPSGVTVFYLPRGHAYTVDFLMSNYDPTMRTLGVTDFPLTRWINMSADPAQGVYTPLFALSNSELAAISSSGNGTESNPYVIVNDQYGSIAPQFAQWDDYLFPVFPGLLLANTSAYVTVTPPSFEINIPSWEIGPPYIPLNATGVPLTNNLQIQFYDASNISLVHASGISGWFSVFLYEYPESSVMLWNCTNVLVAANTFLDQGDALLLYGGTNNTLWGNTFLPESVVGNASLIDDSGSRITGLNESESGDLVYDNSFQVPIPATTPTADPFLCGQYGYCYPVAYTDTWNISRQPASDIATVNGWNLTGSIVGTSYQGGNYWSNYGTTSNPLGVLPYNDSGQITVGGDYVPLVANVTIAIDETGLPFLTSWSFSITGAGTGNAPIKGSGTGSAFDLSLPPGAYTITAASSGYSVSPSEITPTVGIGGATVTFTFSPLPGLLALVVTPASASVWVNGAAVTLSHGDANDSLAAGVVSVEAIATGYYPYFNNLTLAKGGTDQLVIVLNPVTPPVGANGWLNLTVSPSFASLWVDGASVALSSGASSVSLAPGVHSVEVTATGYYPYFNNVTVASHAATVLTVDLNAVSSSSSSSSSGISSNAWYLIGALIALAAILLIALVYFARRPRNPTPVTPITPSTASAPTASAPPWQETPPSPTKGPPTSPP